MTLVFVPVSSGELAAWAAGGTLSGPRLAFAVTPAFMDAFGYASPTDEDAEHEVLRAASVESLIEHGQRMVAVAETPAELPGDLFGRIRIGDLPYTSVLSIFRDDAQAREVAALAPVVRDMTLERALDAVDVQRMLGEVELLWYGPTEWPEACGD